MEHFFGIDTFNFLLLALLVGFAAGLIKGVVGFGVPTVLMLGISSFASAEVALAALILPALLTNGWQALRQGPGAAWASVKQYRVFVAVLLAVLVCSAQLVPVIPESVLLLIVGVAVSVFVGSQIIGYEQRLPTQGAQKTQAGFGALAGFLGGVSGIWGPPTVAMLTAMRTDKTEAVRVQGVIYGLGAVALLVGHLSSGVLRSDTAPLSLVLISPALLGLWVGFQIHDRIDQSTFRKATLVLLLLAGLNLIRRGIF
ncbi:MAG: TSUP family transporter [Roseovarius sp.]